MRVCARTAGPERSWVGLVARTIPDPVLRLRFLKATAPDPLPDGRFRRASWRLALAGLAILAAALSLVLWTRVWASEAAGHLPAPAAAEVPSGSPAPAAVPAGSHRPASEVWLVERSADSESYSNGLRIDNRFLAPSQPRSYLAFPAGLSQPVRRHQPAGVVFHTTESQQAPFEAGQNRVLRRLGESVLDYVRRRRAYNFLIDRFGRVHRVVPEDQAANHAGYSAWADPDWLYINLNHSFLAVSFEASSPRAHQEPAISPAQARAAATLVEFLRLRYQIPASNFVTHAQVSLNPANMRVGLHLDWASGFPFESLGLPDNYATALPSLWACGFDADAYFLARSGASLRAGIEAARAILAADAAAAGLTPEAYQLTLRRRYRDLLATVRLDQPRIESE